MMFTTAALPLSVEPVIGESATSLASRLAWRNGAPRLITFCSDLGIDHRGLTNGAESEIRRVAALAGLDPNPLLFWTPRLIEPGWSLEKSGSSSPPCQEPRHMPAHCAWESRRRMVRSASDIRRRGN